MRSALLFSLMLMLTACSGGGGGSCKTEQQNEIVHKELLANYYWYDRIPSSIDYDRFSSPSATLNFLRYATLDRFSYITSQTAFDNLFNNGTYVGYGFGYVVEPGGSAGIRFVYNQSPAAGAGLVRGDEILSVNGQSVATIIAANSWGSLFGAGGVGTPLSMQLRRSSSLIQTLQFNKGIVTINTVLHSEVIVSGPSTIGYLVFNSFLNTSLAELNTVFAQFKAANVNQLILDLRYNGGGSVSVARDLASYIKATSIPDNDLYVELRFNDKKQPENFNYYFRPMTNSLNLNELTVVSTDLTCSASEQVISALLPYFSRVTTVGSTSCGKPVGQRPFNFCDSTMLAVNFAGFNANEEGDYFSGIPADCSATDDIAFDFGDPAEPMLSAARFFIDNMTCQIVPKSQTRPRTVLQGLQAISGAV
jgi:carboxyl-terminal processing protease